MRAVVCKTTLSFLYRFTGLRLSGTQESRKKEDKQYDQQDKQMRLTLEEQTGSVIGAATLEIERVIASQRPYYDFLASLEAPLSLKHPREMRALFTCRGSPIIRRRRRTVTDFPGSEPRSRIHTTLYTNGYQGAWA